MHLRIDLGGALMDSIGEKLREYRRKRGMSRKSLAEGICDESTLYRIEKVAQEPQLYTLRQLCKRLGIPLTHILSTHDQGTSIFISSLKHLCRKYVYERKFKDLDILINSIEKENHRLIHSDLDFSRFIEWHKAILLHEMQNDLHQSIKLLTKLLPAKGLITETDLGIANSIGYLYIELQEYNRALETFHMILNMYDEFPAIEDKLLYVRIVYNTIYTLYYLDHFDEAIKLGERGTVKKVV